MANTYNGVEERNFDIIRIHTAQLNSITVLVTDFTILTAYREIKTWQSYGICVRNTNISLHGIVQGSTGKSIKAKL
jgi:hypothetical protein